MGGDYKVTDQWTMRAGVAYDQTPNNATRDPRIPTAIAASPPGRRLSLPVDAGLSIDAAYSRQFVRRCR